MICAFADDVERELAPGGAFATITGLAAKLAEQALRLAGVFTFVSDPEASMIDESTMRNACQLTLWHGGEALRLFNAGSASAEVLSAEALRVWLIEQAETEVLQSRMLTHGPNRLRDSKSLSAALKLLQEGHWVTKTQERPATWRVWREAI